MVDINNEESLRTLFFTEYPMELITEMATSVLISENHKSEDDFESVVTSITGVLFQVFMLKLAHSGELPIVFENGNFYRYHDFEQWKEITTKTRTHLQELFKGN